MALYKSHVRPVCHLKWNLHHEIANMVDKNYINESGSGQKLKIPQTASSDLTLTALTVFRYCAKFIGQTWSDLVLAAGTVFNQVVFWRPQGPRDASGRVVVDHRSKGHQVS